MAGLDAQLIADRLRQRLGPADPPPDRPRGSPLLLLDPDPRRLLSAWAAAWASGQTVALGDPAWPDDRLQEARRQLSNPVPPAQALPDDAGPFLLIPTGGSGGGLRFAAHTGATLAAAVHGFQSFYEAGPHAAAVTLPLHHVSGLMAALRALLSDGEIFCGDLPSLREDPPAGFRPKEAFLSLVPTQLRRALEDPAQTAWLARFRTILLGGAPAEPTLLDRAAAAGLALSPCYGATETAALVCALRPEEFRAGRRGVGRPLPHATVTLREASTEIAEPGPTGHVEIAATSLFLGYWGQPPRPAPEPFRPGDLGRWDSSGGLHLQGRADHRINSGGEKIDPARVEAALLATGLVQDAAALGLPDPVWGEAVAAAVVPVAPDLAEATLAAAVRPLLAPAERPKRYRLLPALPRQAAGKLDRTRLRDLFPDPAPRTPTSPDRA